MKIPVFQLAVLMLALPGFSACDRDSKVASADKRASEVAAVSKPEAAAADLPTQIKNTLQGRWKSTAEPGVEYEITDATAIRYVGGKADITLKVTYALYPELTCGAMNKQYRDVIACVTLSGKEDRCLAVRSFSQSIFEFVPMGDINSKPTTWTR